MNIYIAYKFSKISDKEGLKKNLISLADVLESLGNKTFILGRDVQNWDNTTHSISSKIKLMFKEIKRNDMVFAYVNTSDYSWGLFIEFHMARVLKKKLVLAIDSKIEEPYLRKIATRVINFDNFEVLLEIIKNDGI